MAEVAEQLHVHPRKVLHLIAAGELKAKNVGSPVLHGARYRIRQAAVDRYLDS